MTNTKNITITILCISAAIMGAMLFVLHTTPTAQALEVRGGDYIMLTAHFTDNQEALYIVDTGQQKLNVYTFGTQRNDMQLRDSMSLAKIFGPAGK